MPAVTVVIPTYNYGRFIGEAIRSVLTQTFQDFEIIVVDDGSTDDTPAVVATFDDSRLRFIRIENSGQSVAINTGLDAAQGEFIAILDADDRWRPAKLERQVAFLRSEPGVGSVLCNFVRFSADGYFRHTQFSFFPELQHVPLRPARDGGGSVLDGDALTHVATFGQFPVWMQATMLRADVIRDVRFSREVSVKAGNDLHFMLRVFPHTTIGFIPDVLVEVRRHGTNNSADLLVKIAGDADVLRKILHEEPLSPAHRAALHRRLGRACCSVGYFHFRSRSPLQAALWYVRALGHSGSRTRALRQLALIPAVPFLPERSPTQTRLAPDFYESAH